MNNKTTIFRWKLSIDSYLQEKRKSVLDIIAKINDNILLAHKLDDIIEDTKNKCLIILPEIPEKPEIEPIYTTNRDGMIIRMKLNFQSDLTDIIYCRPSGPYAMQDFLVESVDHRCISKIIHFDEREKDIKFMNNKIEREANEIKNTLNALKNSTEKWNNEIERLIKDELTKKFEKANRDNLLFSSLKYAITKQEAPKIFNFTKKPQEVPLQTTSSKKGEEQFEIEMKDYEDILNTISTMSMVIERGPHVFKKMGEEHIRYVLLVPLNALYKAAEARGEVFNFKGKTDILISCKGNNIFIAECKFWSGQKGLFETIDQLFERYITWRDTKVAILIFIKDQNPSKVLEKIPTEIQNHSAFLSVCPCDLPKSFRFNMKHPRDSAKTMILTVMCFDLNV
jgi:hypothetical protein